MMTNNLLTLLWYVIKLTIVGHIDRAVIERLEEWLELRLFHSRDRKEGDAGIDGLLVLNIKTNLLLLQISYISIESIQIVALVVEYKTLWRDDILSVYLSLFVLVC